MAVEINLDVLTEQVEQGWKKAQLAEHYGLPVSQMGAALKQAGLKIRKFHAPKFTLVSSVSTEELDVEASQEVSNEDTVTEEVVHEVSAVDVSEDW